MPGAQLKDKIGSLEDRKAQLIDLIAAEAGPAPLLHPNMAAIYRGRVSELHAKLEGDETRFEAIEALRALVDDVRLVPDNSELAIVLRGDLAAMLTFASGKQKPGPLSGTGLSQVSLVAGTGHSCNQRYG